MIDIQRGDPDITAETTAGTVTIRGIGATIRGPLPSNLTGLVVLVSIGPRTVPDLIAWDTHPMNPEASVMLLKQEAVTCHARPRLPLDPTPALKFCRCR